MIKIASEKEVLSFLAAAYSSRPHPYYAFYSSLFNQIITDQKYMLLPVDDRTCTRAHGVFDVLYIKKRRIINLDKHIDRLFHSAQTVNIVPPFNKERTKEIVIDVVQKSINFYLQNDSARFKKILSDQSIGLRLTISSGYGDLSVASLNKEAILYILLFQPYISYEKEKNGVNQYVTKIVKQPKLLTHSKTIDYIENAMMANESKIKGGYQGIKALQNNVLLQAATANIAFIFGKEFATPRFQTVIEGTTIKKVLKFVEELIKQGHLQRISFRDITIEQSYKANQMMVLGGDKIVPVLNFNDHAISLQRGEITTLIQSWYQKANQNDTVLNLIDLQ